MSKYQALIDAPSLRDQIMRIEETPLPVNGINYAFAYKDGHWDARHAAAELAQAQDATIRAILADLEGAEKDAERYRELKKQFRAMSLDMGGNHTWVLASSGRLKGPSMDEAVDAMAQMAGGG